jgi:hypothetical protein
MLIEASTDSKWVARCLEALGHEVISGVLSESKLTFSRILTHG